MRFAIALIALVLIATPARAEGPKPPPSSATKQPAKKLRHLSVIEVEEAIRGAIAETPLARGATLTAVRTSAIDSDTFDKVMLDVPVLPRKAGPMSVTTSVTFLSSGAPVARTTARLDIVLPPEAALAPIPKGAPILLSIRRGLVEVTIAGVAGADSDIGGILPVVLRPSGRVLRARAIDKDHAVAEDS
jgi:hypothetical protein